VTNTRTQVDRYELLPGLSAYRRWRIATTVSTVLSILAGLTLGLLKDNDSLVDRLTPAEWVLFFVPVAVDIVVSVILFRAAARRSRAEGAAGYTTRISGYTKYDQVNPRTGEVIRRAGSAVLALPSAHGDGAVGAVDTPPGSLRFTGRSLAGRTKLILWIGAAAIVGVTALASYSGFDDIPTATLFFLGVLAFVALITGVTFWAVIAYFRGYLKSAKLARPDAFLFLTQSTPELQQAVSTVGLGIPKGGYFAVTVGTLGLEFWARRSSIDPVTTLPWSSIARVQPGRLLVGSNNGRSFAAPTLHVFRSVNGEELDFPVPVMGPKSMAFASPDDANKVLDVVAQYARIA
jgi:hypothetical protein